MFRQGIFSINTSVCASFSVFPLMPFYFDFDREPMPQCAVFLFPHSGSWTSPWCIQDSVFLHVAWVEVLVLQTCISACLIQWFRHGVSKSTTGSLMPICASKMEFQEFKIPWNNLKFRTTKQKCWTMRVITITCSKQESTSLLLPCTAETTWVAYACLKRKGVGNNPSLFPPWSLCTPLPPHSPV